MNLKNLRTTIQTTIAEGNIAGHHEFVTARNVYLLILVAAWSHNNGTRLSLDELSDSDYRLASEWVILTRSDYSGVVAHIRDMREVLPGLSLTAMADLIRGA